MVGAGLGVFAVWGYVIANTQTDSHVELNPTLLATIFGCSTAEVNAAIECLSAPDPNSRNQEEEGRRLVKKAPFIYFVVTWEEYHKIRDEEQRREYMKDYMREYRKPSIPPVNPGKLPVNSRKPRKPQLAHIDIDIDKDKETTTTLVPYPVDFEVAWKAFPGKAGGNPKGEAYAQYKARVKEGAATESLLSGVQRYAAYIRVTGDEGTKFVQMGKTFFGKGRHWEEPWTLPVKSDRVTRGVSAISAYLQEEDDGN